MVVSCESDSDSTCRVTAVSVKNLVYDEVYFTNYSSSSFGKIRFVYERGQISKIIGGLIKLPYDFGSSEYAFADALENNITYLGDTIAVENKTSFTDNIPSVNKFIVDAGRIVYQKQMISHPFETIEEYRYEYLENLILEKKGDVISRSFHLANGNLVRVDKISYNTDGTIRRIKQLLFSDFDSATNLMKGKFFIHGAFYQAFSANNFHKIEITDRLYSQNGDLVQEQIYRNTFGFGITNGISDLFEQVCD